MSHITESVMISVCRARPRFFPMALAAASGILPKPNWRVAPSGTSLATCSPMAFVSQS